MRKQLMILAAMALLGTPFVTAAERTMPPDDQFQSGMNKGDSQSSTEEMKNGNTVKAEIVEIDGERIITETQDGKQLVFHVEGSSIHFNVGDQLELMVDDQAKTGVILNVVPRDEKS